MSERPRFPLMAKMLVWLCVHLFVLAGAFLLFVDWQLRLGLDSLLSGAAGERLAVLGESLATEMRAADEEDWGDIIGSRLGPYDIDASLRLQDSRWIVEPATEYPDELIKRLAGAAPGPLRPPRAPGRPRAAGEAGPPRDSVGGPGPRGAGRPRGPDGPRPAARRGPPTSRPLFLARIDGAYWAAIDLPLFQPPREVPRHGVLVLRSTDPSAGGLFFDLTPWVMGGLAVLGLSLVLWAPFVFGITRYVSRLMRTTERISEGDFEARVGASRLDELGVLGRSIEAMAGRLDRLVRGQKRFLGDVAHELCSPLARVRTGLGILEQGIEPGQKARLESIEEDASELSELVAEILAFTKASTAPEKAKLEELELEPLVREAASRECPHHPVDIVMPRSLKVTADRALLSRALANLFRNAHRHGGPDCHVTASAKTRGSEVRLQVMDDGPGVPVETLDRLFEPFYRPDAARTREAGGSGLGMAIVRAGIEACGGTVSARLGAPRGLVVRITLPLVGTG